MTKNSFMIGQLVRRWGHADGLMARANLANVFSDSSAPRHFLFGCDHHMVEAMGVTWGGIYQHRNRSRSLVFHWRMIGIPLSMQRAAKAWCRRRGIVLHTYDLTGLRFRSCVTNPNLSEATTLRLVPLQDLREPGECILYLDCDTVVLAPLDSLFEVPLGDCPCAALDDPSIGLLDRKLRLGLSPDVVYFNAGVLVINTTEWIRRNIAERAQKFLYENPERCPYEDQDGLNATIAGDFVPIDEYFNRFSLLEKSTKEWDKGRWAVIHFASRPKPWERTSTRPVHREFAVQYWRAARRGLRPLKAGVFHGAAGLELWALRQMDQYASPETQERIAWLRFLASHPYVVLNTVFLLTACVLKRRDLAKKYQIAPAAYYEDRLQRIGRYPSGTLWVFLLKMLRKSNILDL